MRAPSFWFKDRSLLSWLLQPLAWIYSLITHLRWVFTHPQKVGVPVICVGNFVMGGAGKTPTVLLISRILKSHGHTPHVISRGYKRKTKEVMQVDPHGHTVADVGDEPLLLATHVPTWVGTDRIACAWAAERAGATVIIMDDGFQSPPLFKDLALVVVDGAQCLGNGAVFPAGPLREPLERGLKRADAVLTIGPCDLSFKNSFQLTIKPKSPLPTGPLVAFAGIGYPEKFRKSLLENGANIVLFVPFPDHHSYSEKDLRELAEQAQTLNASLITTSKDFVKLPKYFAALVKVWEIDLVAPQEFEEWLVGKI